jgi:hypothetical protein
MKINEKVATDIKNSVLCWLATVDRHGAPSVSPKEIWNAFDKETLVVADIASSNSVRNIQENPEVCLSFIDIFRQRGFKIYGQATIVAKTDPQYRILGSHLFQAAGTKFEIRNVIKVDVERIGRILAPSYGLMSEVKESEIMEDAFKTYGVRPNQVQQ